MSTYKETLNNITTFVFDVDGVLTDGSVLLLPPNEMIRTMHTRDGYAMQLAVKKGYNLCIITGGNSPSVKERLQYLGIQDVYMASKNKVDVYNSYKDLRGISDEEVLYMGDDIPDYRVMEMVGLPACPADAAEEIKRVAKYISPVNGGKGCVRDVIEQTMKVQGKWFDADSHEW